MTQFPVTPEDDEQRNAPGQKLEFQDTRPQEPKGNVQGIEDSFDGNVLIREALAACRSIRSRAVGQATEPLRNHPSSQSSTQEADLERDFTTAGQPGSLECPFAKTAHGTAADPIAAEFHQDGVSVPAPSTAAQARGKCPIRYLDQHSPEEVAKYFENHKHEIPRSHEICVKRYQQNQESIRQLDAKYGNLVNMIQGLGLKHKRYLPEEDDEGRARSSISAKKVEQWAESYNNMAVEQETEDSQLNGDEKERRSYFERPLREVRVGESPSRPWGIRVPVTQAVSQSVTTVEKFGAAVPPPEIEAVVQTGKEAGKAICPFGHGDKVTLPNSSSDAAAADARHTSPRPGTTSPLEQELNARSHHPQARIVFSGPVFFGYTAEQATVLLETGNLGKGHH